MIRIYCKKCKETMVPFSVGSIGKKLWRCPLCLADMTKPYNDAQQIIDDAKRSIYGVNWIVHDTLNRSTQV